MNVEEIKVMVLSRSMTIVSVDRRYLGHIIKPEWLRNVLDDMGTEGVVFIIKE